MQWERDPYTLGSLYVEKNKPDTEIHMSHAFSYMWSLGQRKDHMKIESAIRKEEGGGKTRE
jgi:hypothetical protein